MSTNDYQLAQLVNFDYKEESDTPVFIVSCYTKDNKRWLLYIKGDRVRASFGCPYDEFWKIMGDSRIIAYRRGPDSPFGEPVMHVEVKKPEDVGGGKNYKKRVGKPPLREYFTHTYQADIKFEKKCVIDLEFKEGYFLFDPKMIDQYGYIDDKYIRSPPDGFEKFDANKKLFYIDTEWDMSKLTNEFGEFRSPDLKGRDNERSAVTIISVLDSQVWKLDAFTWHPNAKTKEFVDEYVSRLPEETKAKLKQMPQKYQVNVHAYTNELEMLQGLLRWWSETPGSYPDCILGYNAVGGIHGKGKDKHWINGFDMPWLYKRMEYLNKKEKGVLSIHRMSPLGDVYFRYGVPAWQKIEVVTKLVSQTDTWHGVEYFDVTAKEAEIKDQKLDTVSSHFLHVGKVKYDYDHVWELWEKEPKLARYYNQGDTEATAAIDQLFMLSEDEYNRSLYAGAKWEDGREASKLHDQINLRFYKDKFYLDTKYQRERDDEGEMVKEEGNEHSKRWARTWLVDYGTGGGEKRGGYVPEPKVGMHRKVAVMDFSKFYPSTSIVSNCGPETFVNMVGLILDGRGLVIQEKRPRLKKTVDDWDVYISWVHSHFDYTPTHEEMQVLISNDLVSWDITEVLWNDVVHTPGGFFRKTPMAKNVLAFKELNEKRKPLQKKAKEIFKIVKDYYSPEYKRWDKKQFSFKGLTNARFGVTGMDVDRLYMIQIFNTITLTAQTVIKECIRYLVEDLGYEIVGGDTDSVFVQLKYDPVWVEKDGRSDCVEMEAVSKAMNEHIKIFAREEFNIDDASMFDAGMETYNDYFLIVTAKHYIMRTVWKEGVFLPGPKPGQVKDPRIFYKGVKRVRRESAIISASVQDQLSMITMNGEPLDPVAKKCFEMHNNFKKQPLENVAKTIALGRALSEYAKGTEQWKAFTLANEYFNAGFVLGSRVFCTKLKYCPRIINDRKVPDDLGDVIAFTPEMIPKMVTAGLEFDWYDLEDSAIAGPADEILKRYGIEYWKLVEGQKIFDATAW